MLRKKIKRFTLALILTAFTGAYADINIHEGEWEITSKIEMKGMPIQVKIQETTITQCIDKEKIIPKTDKKINKYCTISEQKIEGDTVTWKMQCTNNMQSEGSVTYHGDTFEGVVNSNIEVPNIGAMTMVINMKGKRIGACK